MIFSENRYPARIKSGPGFFGIMLWPRVRGRVDPAPAHARRHRSHSDPNRTGRTTTRRPHDGVTRPCGRRRVLLCRQPEICSAGNSASPADRLSHARVIARGHLLMRIATNAENPGQRVALVTGGTHGIGRAVALELARGGDRVLLAGRSAERGAQVVAALGHMRPRTDHSFIHADLSLLADAARVAAEVKRHAGRLDAAVFCAGRLSLIPEWTAEQLERTFVLTYLSRYLLARLLLPLLADAPSGRLVLVANANRYGGKLDFDDLQHRRGKPGLNVVGRTQLANELLAVELAERLRATCVEVTYTLPGPIRKGAFRNPHGLPRSEERRVGKECG